MRRMIMVAVAALVATVLPGALPAGAATDWDGNTRNCVTFHEYGLIKNGSTLGFVRDRADARGEWTTANVLKFQHCGAHSVYVTFKHQNGARRVVKKRYTHKIVLWGIVRHSSFGSCEDGSASYTDASIYRYALGASNSFDGTAQAGQPFSHSRTYESRDPWSEYWSVDASGDDPWCGYDWNVVGRNQSECSIRVNGVRKDHDATAWGESTAAYCGW